MGLPGLVLALWVLTLREPVRGAIDGLTTPEDPAPFRGFVQELFQVIPPFTVFGAASRGTGALVVNLLGAAFFAGLAWALWRWTGVFEQWLFLGVGYYAVFSWAMGLRARDLPTFKLTWGSPAFLCVVLGYGTVAFTAYAASYWGAPYAERALGVDKTDLGWFLGAPAAVAGFLGVIIGGRLADFLLERRPEGRVWVILFGLVTPLPAMWLAYTTDDVVLFYIGAFLAQMLSAAALGAAAASSQALVLPRMRGLATATFFLSTTLIGLGLGPFMAGYVSATNGDDLSLGVLSTLIAAPFGFVLLIAALRLVPQAAASVVERARAAGEPV